MWRTGQRAIGTGPIGNASSDAYRSWRSGVSGFRARGTPQHIDYILLSPALFAKVSGGGIWRLGAWGGVNGTLWPHYDTVTKATDAASDHAAIYADVTPG